MESLREQSDELSRQLFRRAGSPPPGVYFGAGRGGGNNRYERLASVDLPFTVLYCTVL